MGRRKSKGSKVQSLNLHNPKQIGIINLFAISEGRLSKDEIIGRSNKEIFYRMKNLNYIKETVDGSGIYKATPKLKKFTENASGISYSNGCSNNHSRIMVKAADMLPKAVVMEGRFKGQDAIKAELEKFKKSPEYEAGIEKLRTGITQELKDLETRYQRSGNSQERIDCKREMDYAMLRRDIAYSDNPVFSPDMMVSVTRDEVREIVDTFEERLLEVQGRERGSPHSRRQPKSRSSPLRSSLILSSSPSSIPWLYSSAL